MIRFPFAEPMTPESHPPELLASRLRATFIVILIAVVASTLFLCSCSSGPPKPKTHTSVPSLDVSKEKVRQLQSSIQDSKDGIRRVRTLQERIDYKASILE